MLTSLSVTELAKLLRYLENYTFIFFYSASSAVTLSLFLDLF